MRGATRALVFAGLLLASGTEAATVNVTLRFDPETRAGADPQGRVLLFTPKPLQGGSSGSHFDTSASPDLLMEPGISPALRAGRVDLTRPAMQDFGWPKGSFAGRIQYSDAAGVGFNDPALGSARRAALEFALGRWQRLLGSSVRINVEAGFRSFPCSEEGGTLAAAGPNFAFRDFPGGEPGVWYPGALAESLSGQNLSTGDDADPGAADMRLSFNSDIDDGCLGEGTSFYYPTDDDHPPNQISFATVAMHELGHGLGFTILANLTSGELFLDAPDIFTTRVFDSKVGKHWDEMSNQQRRKSAVRAGKVSFDGERTTEEAADFLSGSDVLLVNSPRNLARTYRVGSAVFGPRLEETGVTGDLALVDDASAQPTFACQPLINGSEIAGKVALIDRGECLFTQKVKNAQNAGAIAVVIIHNEPGPPPALGGSDETITIPSVRVARRDGRKLKRRVRR